MKGYIYKLYNDKGDYYGSTIRENLKFRLAEHKYKSKTKTNCGSKLLFEFGKVFISLIKAVDVSDETALKIVEQDYINKFDCVNIRDSHVNIKTPTSDMNNYLKEYRNLKKQQLKEKRTQQVICPICVKSLNRCGFRKHYKLHF